MIVTGELTSGAIGIMVTIAMAAVAWWVKTDRQSTRFDLMIATMQKEILTNRDNVKIEVADLKSEFKAYTKSIDDMKLQLATISAQQNMAHMFSQLPGELARAMGEARGRHWQRNKEDAA